VDVLLHVETRGLTHRDTILRGLAEHGYLARELG
jgi:hypothetical protein